MKLLLFLLVSILPAVLALRFGSPLNAGKTAQPGAFLDGTQRCGIQFLHRSSPTTKKYLPETMASGVALFDYDNDGYEASAGVAGAGWSTSATWVDYDNDGKLDLIVARAAKRLELAATEPKEQAHFPTPVMRHVSPREAAAALSKPKSMLNERQRKIVKFLKRTPDFATMRHLILSFRSILRNGTVSSLKRWIEKAGATSIGAIRKFVRQLKRDRDAIENAVEQRWSNGPVEGHINRLKTLKRQMYGRAKFELLRARTLPLVA